MKLAVVIASTFALVCGCDWSLHRMQEQPRCGLDQATTLLPGGACDLAPPDGAVAFGAPLSAPRPSVTRALILRGRDRFDRFCAPCHGVLADGDSAIARDMQVRRPPTLLDADRRALTDDKVLTIIARGYGLMPSYGAALDERDRAAVLVYVRVLQSGQEVASW